MFLLLFLFGYYTKYDCASADLNPIGSLTKSDLRCFLDFAIKHLPLPFLEEFLSAPPSAELSASQTDEVDMGLSYATLSRLAYARKDMGPSTLFHDSEESLGIPSTSTHQFLRKFTVNRHKAVILTPSCHLQSISTDVFFERKPFMYPTLDQMLWNPFLETLALDSPCQQKLNEEEIIDLIS
ncbi:Glutamine-dependent NAD(+) synthetase [Coelomomyces lativittatus]|nr:Glutamine-dependent NAD(+) synthetase [Coelomomyces lativittatus]KAJ1518254.1 Glutamine-dependent NAD(+) synthetase [Coelomomyces lativittatus]